MPPSRLTSFAALQNVLNRDMPRGERTLRTTEVKVILTWAVQATLVAIAGLKTIQGTSRLQGSNFTCNTTEIMVTVVRPQAPVKLPGAAPSTGVVRPSVRPT
jgi:hypothetical protein